ncbi:MAG: carbamoyl-phosphate synthase large subunit [Firmicutes bacterium]|nr:carbamoyl-phosphate synthase large subunit [Bacillota bacterium]
MPKDKSLKKVMLIGSGPIVIGQAAEFDYAGTQACRVLKDNGIEIILVNSNPATIMTDKNIADKIYIEPLTLTTVKRIIKKEKPDGILSGLGGQTGLTLSMQLAKSGFLSENNVRLLGSLPDTIDKAEDRQLFKDTMIEIGQPVIPSRSVNDVEAALEAARVIGYPVVVRPAFTLGGAGGGFANSEAELKIIAGNGLAASPITQVLIEKSIAGWKEIEFEVMRDRVGNKISVCSLENFDPVGVHTGDSIVVAPCLTLADKELQMLRTASLEIVDALGVEGGCNVQLALNPHSFEYAVIEVNPRVSRSSALASKATGYPIAKVATLVAIGYTLDEILNQVTGNTYASFEPALDYVVVKLPKWPFDKFVYADNKLGTQMKATGEVMAMADNFEEALLKAVRGAELGLADLNHPKIEKWADSAVRDALYAVPTDDRLFIVYEALKRGITLEEIHSATKIDRWFLNALVRILNAEKDGASKAKRKLVYKMVDTCAAEFASDTAYFYSIQNGTENEVLPFIKASKKKKVVVLGSGPIRIGQGIEFDYASVHCVWTLRKLGYDAVVINNNPETLSTDFDTADRLYFEPLHIDDVMSVIEVEKPVGVMVAFGGGTAIKLAKQLSERGVKIIGTSADSIDICEDRDRFDKLLEELNIQRPPGTGVWNLDEALVAANQLGYPVLMRPSYVLGGQNMIIAFSDDDIKEYMEIILSQKLAGPVLIDKYLRGREIEVDAICDGEDVLIPGIMEQVEATGVHSGDSISVYPTINVGEILQKELLELTRKIAKALDVRGLINIQYLLHKGDIFVIEVNPRASRTVPYISKVTGIDMVDLAVKTSLGQTFKKMGIKTGIAPVPDFVTVKVPKFSFEKLAGVDTLLGPEMKSTGEVLGIGRNLREALYKGLVAAGYKMKKEGGVLITVSAADKEKIVPVARKFARAGFKLYATAGTAKFLRANGLETQQVDKIIDNPTSNTETLIESGEIAYVVSTSEKGRDPSRDDVKVRRRAVSQGVSYVTSIDTANALIESILSGYTEETFELVELNTIS